MGYRIIIKPIPSSKSNVTTFSPQPARIGSVKNISDLFSLVKTYDTDFKPVKCSAVINDDGTPKKVYHGTSRGGFSSFDTYGYYARYGLFGNGAYFTENREVAEQYTNKGKGDNKQVYTVYLSIKNPLDMDKKADIKAWRITAEKNDLSVNLHEGMTTEAHSVRGMIIYIMRKEN